MGPEIGTIKEKRISKETISSILDKADIVEVIGEFVQLKKAGKDYKGLSPFGNEKDPSFFVSPAKGIFKDFSSGKGGNVITFLMEQERLSYPEALRWLAKKYNIELQEQEPEDPEADHRRELIFQMNGIASRFFSEQLYREENARVLEYIKGRFTDDDIVTWQIGIAPDAWNNLWTDCITEGTAETSSLITANLVREKNGKTFDYFRNRVMFPIENSVGVVVGFGGRALPWEMNESKYINSPDSQVYNKSRLLYGLSRARKDIILKEICHIVEGYADVISMHAAGIVNTVAPCGTALTPEQIGSLKKLCTDINLVFDGDDPGFKATLRAAENVLKAGMQVNVTRLPEGEDPGSFIKEGNADYITKNMQPFLPWRAKLLLENTGDDPMAQYEAIKEIARLLGLITDHTIRGVFMDDLCLKHKLKKRSIIDLVKENSGDVTASSDNLPPEVNPVELERWGFYEYKNEYYFRTKDGNMNMSNFVMKPLFHVKTVYDSKRAYELINIYGYRVVLEFDMQEMTSIQSFRKKVEGQGNFLFWGQDMHFGKLKRKLYEQTRTCNEVLNLGWQKEGFWAWSNGIIDQGEFKKTDDHGIIEFEGASYFIPAFSKIYLHDKSIFIDERKFIYKKQELSLREWSEKFIRVFGDNARIGICFWMAALFRDHILHIFRNFPMLNLFGPKGSGKSQMAMSLSCLFGQGQTPFNIHNGTKPGLAEHTQQFINAIAWVDEYKNSLESDKIETLKSIYDSIGRSRMNMDKAKKKETTQVNSAVIISGQEMPTADVALFSRVIFLWFNKTVFTEEEKTFYQELKGLEGAGLSHLTSEIVGHRDFFKKQYYDNYDKTLSDLSGLIDKDTEDRILRNYCTILAAFRTLEPRIDISLVYSDLLKIVAEYIKIQNEQVGNSSEITAFWEMMEGMFDRDIIMEGRDFKIEYISTIIGTHGKKVEFGKGNAKWVLKLKFNIIYKLYSEEIRKGGNKPLPKGTLHYYLQNYEHFITIDKNCWFYWRDIVSSEEKKQRTTAYCFDYGDKLRSKVNLIREKATEIDRSNQNHEENEEDLPF